ncbi:Coproporphyrinogen III oxidase [Cyathus striatus]|nr:Coproporphyrinogen III oxidase [Cyathus striatus]
MREQVAAYIRDLQDRIVRSFEALDPHSPPFKRDAWQRPEGGSGQSCGGVNISIVHGTLPPAAIKQMRGDHTSMPLPDSPTGLPFFAAGLSLKEGEVLAWWFGGGADLTPSYLYEEDAVHFHTTLKEACAKHGEELFPSFKKWCDEYFYLPHRSETRGLSSPTFILARPTSPDEIFAFLKSVGDSFYTPEQRRWQLLRRGRYVEFNLVYDRGTKFGLFTPGARVESILMSLPETARWEYMSEVGTEEASEEAKPREWV